MKYLQDELEQIVQKEIIPKIADCNIFTFKGPLGAGKTTLIKEILRAMGVREVVTSPTFTYVNTYKTDTGKTVFHFDLYRLKDVQSFLDAGFDEYLYQCEDKNVWCFIEWPEVIEQFLLDFKLKNSVCRVSLSHCLDEQNKRSLKFF